MSNVAILESCNYKCKYCFAEEFTEHGNNKLMSLEDFKRVTDFLLQTSDGVGLIGGEPTLHPEFDKIVEYLIKREGIKYVTVFTNGSSLMEHLNVLASSKVGILLNYNSPKELMRQFGEELGKVRFESAREQIIKFNKLCPDKMTIGVNIFDTNTDWSHIVDIFQNIENKKERVLRVSTVAPNINSDKKLNLVYYNEMAESLLTLLETAKDLVDRITFDCSKIPVCVMEQYKERFEGLLAFYETKGGTDYHKRYGCEPVLDVTVDLQVIRCFAMSRLAKVNMFDYKDMMEIYKYFKHGIDGICYNMQINFLCNDCKLSTNKQCNGGCLSFTTEKALAVKSFIERLNGC